MRIIQNLIGENNGKDHTNKDFIKNSELNVENYNNYKTNHLKFRK